MNLKTILIAIFAGIASALCIMATFRVGSGAAALILIATFPIYVATLSHGTKVGVGASITAIIIASATMGAQTGIATGLLFTIPASIIGHQANLAQGNEAGETEWFPLQQLFFNLCAILCIGIILFGFVSGFNLEALTPQLNEVITQVLQQNPPPRPLSQDEMQALVKSVSQTLPFAFAGVWLIVHVANLNFASIICRLSNMMPRPKDNISRDAALPKFAIGIMLASIVLSLMLNGTLQPAFAVIAGIFTMAFSLLGLASLHNRTRGNPIGIAMLFMSYVAILLIYPVIYLFAISGAIRTFTQQNTSTNSPPKAG